MTVENVLLIVNAAAGLLGVPITTALKRAFGWSDVAALGVAVGVSFVLAAIIAVVGGLVTGVPTDPQQVAEGFGVVFSMATILFKALVAGKK